MMEGICIFYVNVKNNVQVAQFHSCDGEVFSQTAVAIASVSFPGFFAS